MKMPLKASLDTADALHHVRVRGIDPKIILKECMAYYNVNNAYTRLSSDK